MESVVLKEEWSPVSAIQAFVEKSDMNYYFYLWINPEDAENAEMRSCWICNRVKAPANVKEAFKMAGDGNAPCMPAEFVNHDLEGIELDADSLEIQWFEEGDSAALLSGDKIIAVIPSFSGYKGFNGYSIYANGTGPFAWELKGAYERFEREVKDSREFWDSFENSDYWGKTQDYHLKLIKNFFGEEEKYYVIDGEKFPPKALVKGRQDGIIYGITLGVSLIPMPKVEMSYQEEYKNFRRMELGFACDEKYEDLFQQFLSTMSWLAAYPWLDQTFLGHGHTIPYSYINGFDYILFINARLVPEINSPVYDDFMGDKINLLWLKLITKEEQQFIKDNGIKEYLKGKNLKDIHIFG